MKKDIQWLKNKLFEIAWEENKSQYSIKLESVYKIIDELEGLFQELPVIPKYYVDLDEIAYVAKWNGDNQVNIYTYDIFGSDEFEFHLTEQEIKNYDERFWPFAVKIEEDK